VATAGCPLGTAAVAVAAADVFLSPSGGKFVRLGTQYCFAGSDVASPSSSRGRGARGGGRGEREGLIVLPVAETVLLYWKR